MKFEGPDGTQGDVATCTSDKNDDKTLADLLEKEDLGFRRVGNNFLTDDSSFNCQADSIIDIASVCQEPEISGVATCGNGGI